MVHRLIAAAVIIPLAGLLLVAWRARDFHPQIWALAVIGGALFVAQIVAGASNIWYDFAIPARVIHLSLATALWMSLALLVLLTPRWFPQGLGPWRAKAQGGMPSAD